MSAEIERAGGARPAIRWLRLTDIKVERGEDESATSARPRFAWNMGEVSGSLGDLGTFLPHIVGAITVVKMDPTGILTTFGLFYAFTGAFYGVPMAVQPMKGKRCFGGTFRREEGEVMFGADGGSDTCRFQSISICRSRSGASRCSRARAGGAVGPRRRRRRSSRRATGRARRFALSLGVTG